MSEKHHNASNNENKLLKGKTTVVRGGGYTVGEIRAMNLNSVRNSKNNYL